MQPKKLLKDLTLLDRFLFDEIMENPENMQILLEIILGRDIMLAELPQTEKEQRTFPAFRQVRFDVWAKDTEGTIYDAEPQQKNTNNLPKRSRYYQAMIDTKLLQPGDVDFNLLNNVFVIVIGPFDLFGYEKYMYTFHMTCKEERGLALNDGAIRIFLNTNGKNDDEVSPELVELLHYMEHTSEIKPEATVSGKIRQLQNRVEDIKSSEKIGVKYMQAWEEMVMERQEGYAEGDNMRLVKDVEAIMENFKIDLETACKGLNHTVEEYYAAKKFIAESEMQESN